MKEKFYSKVFGWMFIGLLITFGSGYFISTTPAIMMKIFNGPIYFLIIIAEIAIAIFLSTRIYNMDPKLAKGLYLAYTALTGLTFATIFIMFHIHSIMIIFLVSAIIFGFFALIGSLTKIDLSKMGVFLVMALLAIIILEVINIFLMNHTLDITLCIISIIIFIGYVAYDMQKIKQIAQNSSIHDNIAIIGAFELYLDFINIFINLLNLFGNRKD